jgi:Flp pilus assembly protein TadG
VKHKQSGATAVEFALVLVIYFAFVLAIVDFARMLFTWNAANEAARAGARYAVVCDNTSNAAAVLARMQALLPQIQTINVGWDPAGCDASSCIGVRVTITGMNYYFMSPIAGLANVGAITMPTFATYLMREDMRQDAHSGVICP